MTSEQIGALIGIAVYAAMKTIDRIFRVVDHVIDERLDDHDHDQDQEDDTK